MQAEAERIADAGGKALIIPLGASTSLGALGYVRAAIELHEAIDETRDRDVHVTADVFGLVEPRGGLRDEALLLVDPAAPIQTSPGGIVTIPTLVNPDFGRVVLPQSRGRILRVGIRIGGPVR